MTDEIDPVTPSNALEMYLQSRQSELAESSLDAHRLRLQLFVRWCDEEGDIDTLDELTGRDLHDYRVWRSEGIRSDSISPETLRSNLLTLRVYLRFAESIDAVSQGFSDKIVLPDPANRSRSEMLDADHAESLLKHLERYEYASDAHVILRLLWETGIRAGTLRSLDLRDYLPEKGAIRIKHRPTTDTPLKNGSEADRQVALKQHTCKVIDDYIDEHRVETTDEHGRRPLLTTKHGRRALQSIRKLTYYWTCPCRISGDCPHGRDPSNCDAATWTGSPECPSSVSTHPIRRGAITHHLKHDVPTAVASDRMDVSPGVLDEHYSELTDEESMQRRRDHLDNI